jgi:hypothetical protein
MADEHKNKSLPDARRPLRAHPAAEVYRLSDKDEPVRFRGGTG